MTDAQKPKQNKKFNFVIFLPVIAILGLGILFADRLLSDEDRDALPSALLNKQAPDLTLPELEGASSATGIQISGISPEIFKGNITVVNIWASWCIPCRTEHPLLIELADKTNVKLAGINMRDKPDNALKFLNELGNPYDYIGVDPMGRAAVEWGGYGVPETFIVDKKGFIQFKHVGPINDFILNEKMIPLINTLM